MDVLFWVYLRAKIEEKLQALLKIIDELKIENVIVVCVTGDEAAVFCIFVSVACVPLPVVGTERCQVNSEFVSSLVRSCRKVVDFSVELKAENQILRQVMCESNEQVVGICTHVMADYSAFVRVA